MPTTTPLSQAQSRSPLPTRSRVRLISYACCFCHIFTAFVSLVMLLSIALRWVLPSQMVLLATTTITAGDATAQSSSLGGAAEGSEGGENVDLSWYAPNRTEVNNLSTVINGTGIYGWIFNSSQTYEGAPYGTYSWCNMPHVRRQEYPLPSKEYQIAYVEVIHRHHKRTPYAANTFPVETQYWNCSNTALYYYGAPYPHGNASASTFWSVLNSSANPFLAPGFPGNCQFPQISHGGLDDSWQHGKDLYGVYHDLLHLIPDHAALSKAVSFRVTNNVITSEVAGMVINGMFGTSALTPYPLLIESDAIDSLEPVYPCSYATNSYSSYSVGGTNPNWTIHLMDSQPLYNTLDRISGVDPTSSGWHQSWDHYFDNLSARLCHGLALPCNNTLPENSGRCVTTQEAEKVFRLGEYEYSYIYRDAPQSLNASTASFGVWVAELSQHLRNASSSRPSHTVYRHNVAHDGSISRLLSILQIDKMVWPGMGSEVVFELWKKQNEYFIRVLWGGQVMRSNNPYLGVLDMIPVAELLAYFDGLTGPIASLIPGLCSS